MAWTTPFARTPRRLMTGLAMLGLACAAPLSAQSDTQGLDVEGWESLMTKGLSMNTHDFLVTQSVNYIVYLQDQDSANWISEGGLQEPWTVNQIREQVERYFAMVEQPLMSGYHQRVASLVSNTDIALLQDNIGTDAEIAAFACALATPPDDAGNMQWEGCEADAGVSFSPAVKTAAAQFIAALNSGITSRIVNDGFGGTTCYAVDRLIDAFTTETFTLEVNVEIGMGPGNARPCSDLKPRWAALVGYERLMATEEFGE